MEIQSFDVTSLSKPDKVRSKSVSRPDTLILAPNCSIVAVDGKTAKVEPRCFRFLAVLFAEGGRYVSAQRLWDIYGGGLAKRPEMDRMVVIAAISQARAAALTLGYTIDSKTRVGYRVRRLVDGELEDSIFGSLARPAPAETMVAAE